MNFGSHHGLEVELASYSDRLQDVERPCCFFMCMLQHMIISYFHFSTSDVLMMSDYAVHLSLSTF